MWSAAHQRARLLGIDMERTLDGPSPDATHSRTDDMLGALQSVGSAILESVSSRCDEWAGVAGMHSGEGVFTPPRCVHTSLHPPARAGP